MIAPRTRLAAVVRAALVSTSVAVLVTASGAACNDRTVGEDAADDDDDPDDTGSDPGVRPGAAGSMYSVCIEVPQCMPLDYCVFPADEAGFCTDLCGPDQDASGCDAAPGGDRDPTCLDIGLGDGNTVCALPCDSLPCPDEMRCEGISTPDGSEAQICF